MILDLGFLNLRQLAEHLGGVDPRTARAVAVSCGLRLQRVRNGAPASIAWLDVFRAIHRIEPVHHASILTELKAPLVDLTALAENLGTTAGALRKRELRGRMVLPPAVVVGTLRLWRPRDILHWQLQQPVTNYVAPDAVGPSAGASA